MKVIDGSNLILGRLASHVAQELLKGKQISIVNAEKIVITGRGRASYDRFKARRELTVKGNPHRGPKFPRHPDKLVRMSVRGMLPFKTPRGKQAFKNLKVFIGVPIELSSLKPETVPEAENKLTERFINLERLSKALGARW